MLGVEPSNPQSSNNPLRDAIADGLFVNSSGFALRVLVL